MCNKTIEIDLEKSGEEQGISLTFTVSRNMRLSDLWCTFRVSEPQSKGMESWERRENNNNAYKSYNFKNKKLFL